MCISFLAIGILKRSKKAFTNLGQIRTWRHRGQSCMNQAVQVQHVGSAVGLGRVADMRMVLYLKMFYALADHLTTLIL